MDLIKKKCPELNNTLCSPFQEILLMSSEVAMLGTFFLFAKKARHILEKAAAKIFHLQLQSPFQ
jgi:hypothetical protein